MPSLFRSRYLGRNGQADYERLNITWNQKTWVDNAYIKCNFNEKLLLTENTTAHDQ